MSTNRKVGNGVGKNYLERIKNNTPELSHPRHQGVKMQAHHIASKAGVARTGLGPKLKKLGYNINYLPNLVFLPSTLQGACHLGVQLHRGNHSTERQPKNMRDTDDHRGTYHTLVAQMVLELKDDIHRKCRGKKITEDNPIIEQMHEISEVILSMIQDDPGDAPLTDLAHSFQPDSEIGCGGNDSIPGYRESAVPCVVGRNHQHAHVEGQLEEGISMPKPASYELEVGK